MPICSFQDDNNTDDDVKSLTQFQIKTESLHDEIFLEPVESSIPTYPTPQRKRKQNIQDLNSIVDKISKVSKQVNPLMVPENEFDIFANSVGAQLKSMPLNLALQAQNYIQNYLYQIRLQHLKSESHSAFESPTQTNPTVSSTPSVSTTGGPQLTSIILVHKNNN